MRPDLSKNQLLEKKEKKEKDPDYKREKRGGESKGRKPSMPQGSMYEKERKSTKTKYKGKRDGLPKIRSYCGGCRVEKK